MIASLIAVVAAGCRPAGPPSAADYSEEIFALRAAKNTALRQQPDPIPADQKDVYLPLAYYPVDFTAHVPAEFFPGVTDEPLQMVYSDGAIRDVRRVGRLKFTLHGRSLELSAFVEADAPDTKHLFVPFADETNATETYHAGRLLDLDRMPTGVYEIDFNQAYNPMCYFNPLYSCPLPLKENRLPVEVRAGERVKLNSKF